MMRIQLKELLHIWMNEIKYWNFGELIKHDTERLSLPKPTPEFM